ncbi:hypothetical protein LFWB_3960 [Candidatus Phytoplasma luffae]|uniref:Uncharacterized protein n=1 Tax=Loofah witches'-broom phytoplasma TaxID=35773 RepID=A0A975ILZ3_LOWBP|nr:hypothetical protein [Candidatus Phytoplasma luffae]QTX02939.1 hypothetical protein LFWB_3690 [Candidatus Phytoplasma luffae]QTX02962.1 hypothetical protein LFWB_3960 [Candidatus Phytoplasma luffae]
MIVIVYKTIDGGDKTIKINLEKDLNPKRNIIIYLIKLIKQKINNKLYYEVLSEIVKIPDLCCKILKKTNNETNYRDYRDFLKKVELKTKKNLFLFYEEFYSLRCDLVHMNPMISHYEISDSNDFKTIEDKITETEKELNIIDITDEKLEKDEKVNKINDINAKIKKIQKLLKNDIEYSCNKMRNILETILDIDYLNDSLKKIKITKKCLKI